MFDLVSKGDKERMQGVTVGLKSSTHSTQGHDNSRSHSRFGDTPESSTHSTQGHNISRSHSRFSDTQAESQTQSSEFKRPNVPLFQGSSVTFKPFEKDEKKQARYDKYLALVKGGAKGKEINNVMSPN